MFRGDFTSNTKLTHGNNHHHNYFDGNRLKEVLMVSTGNRNNNGGSGREDMKPLHNFDLPCLKWGNQKLLRCMKVDSISTADVSVIDRNQSSTRRRNSDFEKRFRSSDVFVDDYKTEKVKSRIGISAGDGEIEATREKLMFDFQKEVVKMKDAILRERLVDPPATTSVDRPWNLRTRRAACKSPRSSANVNVEVLKPNSSPECKYPNIWPSGDASTGGGEKRERPKFSVSLSRRQLEEDFMAMAGRRLPRKPKKRPRIVQKQLDTLFPGLWLSEITTDLYKVPDEAETAKR